MSSLQTCSVRLQHLQALGASERVFELLDRKPAQPEAGTQTPHGTPAGGDIEFDNVWCVPCNSDIMNRTMPYWTHRESCS